MQFTFLNLIVVAEIFERKIVIEIILIYDRWA